MSLVVPQLNGEILMLKYIVGLTEAGNQILHLYSSPTTQPNNGIVLSNISEVSTLTGYSPVTLQTANWTVTNQSGQTSATYTQQTFPFTSAATAYGYYVTDTSTPQNLLWIEQFSGAPFTIPSGGGSISITPQLTLS